MYFSFYLKFIFFAQNENIVTEALSVLMTRQCCGGAEEVVLPRSSGGNELPLELAHVFVSLSAWDTHVKPADAFWQSQVHLSACCERWLRVLPLRFPVTPEPAGLSLTLTTQICWMSYQKILVLTFSSLLHLLHNKTAKPENEKHANYCYFICVTSCRGYIAIYRAGGGQYLNTLMLINHFICLCVKNVPGD